MFKKPKTSQETKAIMQALAQYLKNTAADNALLAKVDAVGTRGDKEKIVNSMLTLAFASAAKDENRALGECLDVATDIFLKVLTKEELTTRIPEGLKNQAAVDVLRKMGAVHLADVCALAKEPEAKKQNTPPPSPK